MRGWCGPLWYRNTRFGSDVEARLNCPRSPIPGRYCTAGAELVLDLDDHQSPGIGSRVVQSLKLRCGRRIGVVRRVTIDRL